MICKCERNGNFTIPKGDFANFLGYRKVTKGETDGTEAVTGDRVLELAMRKQFNKLGPEAMQRGMAYRNMYISHGKYANQPGPPRGGGMMGRRFGAANAHRSDKEPKPSEVPWAHMLKKRVKGVGIYEGGATFKKGMWRPASTCANVGSGFTPA